MNYAAYLREHLADFLLCALAALGLGLNVVQGFHISEQVADNAPLISLATATPLAALFLIGYSKRSLQVGIPAIFLLEIALAIAIYRWIK